MLFRSPRSRSAWTPRAKHKFKLEFFNVLMFVLPFSKWTRSHCLPHEPIRWKIRARPPRPSLCADFSKPALEFVDDPRLSAGPAISPLCLRTESSHVTHARGSRFLDSFTKSVSVEEAMTNLEGPTGGAPERRLRCKARSRGGNGAPGR